MFSKRSPLFSPLTLFSVSNLACRIFYLAFLDAARTLVHFLFFIVIYSAFLPNFPVCNLNEITWFMCFLMTFHQSWCFDVNFISPQFFLRFFCSQCFVSRAQSVATRCSAFGLSMTVAVAMTMLALLCDLLQKKNIFKLSFLQKYCYVNEGLSSWRRKKNYL